MESHGWTMRGPLNTDNIRAQDGTLAATITDGTGYVNFQNDIEARDIDVRRNLSVFNNLEVQGPLAHFIQNLQVDGSVTVGVDLSVGQDFDCRDATLGRDLVVMRNAYVAFLTTTNSLKVQSGGPAAGKILTAINALGDVTWGSGGTAGIASVPTGESILFYKNTAVLGYSIVTTVDDDVVYITKGTAAGGQAGGAAKPGSTWSQPTHIHATRNHTLTISEMPSHTHGISNDNCSGGSGDNEAGPGFREVSTPTGGGNPHNHGNTYSAGGGSSWRPKGQNFTLQTRI